MVRNVVRLVVLALVVHAAVKVVPVFWSYVTFRDAVIEAATYSGRKTTEQLREQVAELAVEHDVPITADEIVVTRRGEITHVSTAWTAQLEYVPQRYYPYDFEVNVQGRAERFTGFKP